jgi:hypothetical protein
MTTVQEDYHDMLMRRVRDERFPSGQLLDRIERMLATPEQFVDYMQLLLDKVDASRYPSGQLLDRVERLFTIVASTR